MNAAKDMLYDLHVTTCDSRAKNYFFLSVFFFILSFAMVGAFYVQSVDAKTQNCGSEHFISKVQEQNAIYKTLTDDMQSAMQKQERLIKNMTKTLDEQERVIRELSIL